MYLDSLLNNIQLPQIESLNFGQNAKVLGLTEDSRRVRPGFVFFARRGQRQNKIKYITQAKEQGALLVLHDVTKLDKGLYVDDIDLCFSKALKLLYQNSFENLKVFGVTGTNGKTTYTYMLKNMLEGYGLPTGIFGTVENSFKNKKLVTDLTSPLAEDFYSFSHENHIENGMKALVCEVSSHALDQKRMGLEFLDYACFTSFSQDHLDYHGSMDEYLRAKRKIKTEALKPQGYLCAPISLKDKLQGMNADFLGGGNFQFKVKMKNFGIDVEFSSSKKSKKISGHLPILGAYNGENFCLAMMTLCDFFGEDFFPDQRVFENFKSPPGRMEPVFYNHTPLCYIDFSHTPDSLEKALSVLKLLDKKVYTVFGCGGDRDKSKRALMGEVSEQLSDKVFLTSDNPRSEDPISIIEDIKSGLKKNNYVVEPNRKKAILKALKCALDDKALVLVAGKGHEKTQEIKGTKTPFSDKEVALNFIKSLQSSQSSHEEKF